MNTKGWTPALLLLTVLAAGTAAAEPDWCYLHPDSLSAPGRQEEPYRLPTNKLFYLEQKCGLCPSQRHTDDPESLNVRMVGKWGGGRSWGVTGRDTLVFLSRGSEVVVINFADTANPEILNYIQARRLAGRPVLVDSLLYLATSGYVEVFDVSDPADPRWVNSGPWDCFDLLAERNRLYATLGNDMLILNISDLTHITEFGRIAGVSGYSVFTELGYAYSVRPSLPCGSTTSKTRPRPSRSGRCRESRSRTSTCLRPATPCSIPRSCTSSTSATQHTRGRSASSIAQAGTSAWRQCQLSTTRS